MIGPVQGSVLAEIAGAGELTACEVAGRLGLPVHAVQRAPARLARTRRAEMTCRQPGSAAGVWCATATGLRFLGVPLPESRPADDRPGRPGECAECRYLITAPGHGISCEAAA